MWAAINPQQIRAVWVGSESHPYAVKPTGTIVAEAIGATPGVLAADWQFACKASTEAMPAGIGFVGSGAGSDAFDLLVTEQLTAARKRVPATRDYIKRRVPIDYAQHVRLRRKLASH